MAYEKITKYTQQGKIDIQRAKFIECNILQSQDNDGWFIDESSGEKYFKIQFTFADKNDIYITTDFNYSKYVLYQDRDTGEDVTCESLCTKSLISCGVKDGSLEPDEVKKAIGNFVRLGGEITLSEKGYQRIKLYINAPISFVSNDISKVDTKSLLAEFAKVNNTTAEPKKEAIVEAEVVDNPIGGDDSEDTPF